MKKVVIAVIVCICILGVFSSDKGSDDSGSSYDKGYEDGVKAALTALRDVSNNWDRYANTEDIEDSIYRNFDDNPYIDADYIRDVVLDQTYTEDELLEKLIKETTIEN